MKLVAGNGMCVALDPFVLKVCAFRFKEILDNYVPDAVNAAVAQSHIQEGNSASANQFSHASEGHEEIAAINLENWLSEMFCSGLSGEMSRCASNKVPVQALNEIFSACRAVAAGHNFNNVSKAADRLLDRTFYPETAPENDRLKHAEVAIDAFKALVNFNAEWILTDHVVGNLADSEIDDPTRPIFLAIKKELLAKLQAILVNISSDLDVIFVFSGYNRDGP